MMTEATIGRRAWQPCPRCADDGSCSTCLQGRTCDEHWRYLLAAEGRMLFLQCPGCAFRWWHDTGFGAGDRPEGLCSLPAFPWSGTGPRSRHRA